MYISLLPGIMDCSICCERFNNSSRLKVGCKGCHQDDVESACRTCCQTFITTNSAAAGCMFCKNLWDRDFMNDALTKKFVSTDLKAHSEKLFIEQQTSLLPSTQPAAIVAKRIKELNDQILLANTERNILKRKDYDQRELIAAFQLEISRLRTGTSTDESGAAVNFTLKCPMNECNGFLNSKYVCSICDSKICKECMEKNEDGHVCNEELKLTVKAILKASKPCPGCGENISKIDGCDHMWCISCHIQFSWRTGAEIVGSNHNPEYYRWMRETGRVIQPTIVAREVICGVQLTDRSVLDIITRMFPKNGTIVTFFTGLYRFYRHTQWVVRQYETYNEPNFQLELLGLRVSFLLGGITKDMWKRTLQQMDKRHSKENTYINIWKLAETVIGSAIEQIVKHSELRSPHVEYTNILKEIVKFKSYTNLQFLTASRAFGSSTCPGISEGWRETPNYKHYIASQVSNETGCEVDRSVKTGNPCIPLMNKILESRTILSCCNMGTEASKEINDTNKQLLDEMRIILRSAN